MIDREIIVNGKEYSIGQDLSLSHAGTVWDGALTLISYWDKNKEMAKKFLFGKRVLELGSGTGAVGICATAF
jgi:predicted nicotinamide N-methyase